MSLGRWRVISSLAKADVLHEWRMSLCMILAVAAIATPLLLFFGLKYGVIETLRKRLLDNPLSLEILPISEKRLDAEWFEKKRADPRVAFVVPHTRRLSAQAEFMVDHGQVKALFDLAPTLDHDVLLNRYKVNSISKDHCVLSAQASEKIRAKVGDTLKCLVSRDRGKVKAERSFKVAAILPEAAGNLPVVYLRLDDLEKIEQFKDGRAVPELGWKGSDPLAYSVAPQAILALATPLDAIREAMLCQNTGFSKFKRIDDLNSWPLPPKIPSNFTIYLLETVGNQADSRDMSALVDKIRGRVGYVLPYNSNLRVTLANATQSYNLKILPAQALGQKFPPINCPDLESRLDFSSKPAPRILLVNSAIIQNLGQDNLKATVSLDLPKKDQDLSLTRSITFTVKLLPLDDLDPSQALVAPALLGQLSLLADRPLYDGKSTTEQPAFLLGRRGYTGFRMYARELELVSSLQKSLEAEGITVKTRSDRIEEILALDHYLDILFWIIAAASLIGGIGCLISNVYANVERKRRELAVLRLVGIHGVSLTIFPLTQAIILTLGGLLTSFLIFHSLALAINVFFSQHLASQEFFCQLTLNHQLATLALALGLATFTGIVASLRMLKIEPAESLRDE